MAAFGIALIAGVPSAFAQLPTEQNHEAATQPSPATVQGPVLRTTTRLVQLNVVVQNKNGQLVRGLNKDDFILLDNGRPQTLALFADGSVEPQQSESAESAGTAKLPANVFGNRVHHEEEVPGSVTVILFDALNTESKDQAFARGEILAFLKQLQPQDHVAIYLLTRKLTVINEFTQDSQSLLEALEHFRGDPSLLLKAGNPEKVVAADTGAHDAKAAQRLASLMNQASSTQSDLANVDRVQITAQAIAAIANHVASIPGRKSLVWVSGGFPISISFNVGANSPVDTKSQNFAPVLDLLGRTLNQANLAIYPVDARGLFVPEEMDASKAHPFGARNHDVDLGSGQDEQQTMELLAARTGGLAYYNTNDIKGAIRRTLSDSTANYLLGFYPDHVQWDGGFHELKLTVKTTGLVVRYRKGYFAQPNSGDSAEDARSALQSALWSPVDATSLGIQARVAKIENGSRKLDLRVKLEAGELLFTEADNHHTGTVDSIYLQLGPGDVVVTADPLTYKMSFDEKQYKAVLKLGCELTATLAIRPETRTLRIVIRDGGSGTLGSVTVPLAKFLPPEDRANENH